MAGKVTHQFIKFLDRKTKNIRFDFEFVRSQNSPQVNDQRDWRPS